jgi:hypothetical protein
MEQTSAQFAGKRANLKNSEPNKNSARTRANLAR